MRRTVSRGVASFVGAAASLFMASEVYRDLTGRMRYFVAPAWWKVIVLVILLWLAMAEAAKVHARIEDLVG